MCNHIFCWMESSGWIWRPPRTNIFIRVLRLGSYMRSRNEICIALISNKCNLDRSGNIQGVGEKRANWFAFRDCSSPTLEARSTTRRVPPYIRGLPNIPKKTFLSMLENLQNKEKMIETFSASTNKTSIFSRIFRHLAGYSHYKHVFVSICLFIFLWISKQKGQRGRLGDEK